jgi:hypothetical protein
MNAICCSGDGIICLKNMYTVLGGQGRQKLNKKESVRKNWKLLVKGIKNKIK